MSLNTWGTDSTIQRETASAGRFMDRRIREFGSFTCKRGTALLPPAENRDVGGTADLFRTAKQHCLVAQTEIIGAP